METTSWSGDARSIHTTLGYKSMKDFFFLIFFFCRNGGGLSRKSGTWTSPAGKSLKGALEIQAVEPWNAGALPGTRGDATGREGSFFSGRPSGKIFPLPTAGSGWQRHLKESVSGAAQRGPGKFSLAHCRRRGCVASYDLLLIGIYWYS